MKVKFCYEKNIVSFGVPDDVCGTELLYDHAAHRLRLIHGVHQHDCLENWDFEGTFDETVKTLDDAFDAEAECGLKRVEVDDEIIYISPDVAGRVAETHGECKGKKA